MKPPKTVQEWASYFASADPNGLTSKVRAMNSPRFVDMLSADGLSGNEVEQVFMLAAKRMQQEGLEPAPGGYVDMVDMVNDPALASVKLPKAQAGFTEPDWIGDDEE